MEKRPPQHAVPPAGEITDLLEKWRRGDSAALDEILEIAFDDLRRLARGRFGRNVRHELQPTELIGAIYTVLHRQRARDLRHRGELYNLVARLMERTLIDAWRERGAVKRGGRTFRVAFLEAFEVAENPHIARGINAAVDVAREISALEELAPQQAAVARLRYLLGLTYAETGEALGLSTAAVVRRWQNAKRFLARQLRDYRDCDPIAQPGGSTDDLLRSDASFHLDPPRGARIRPNSRCQKIPSPPTSRPYSLPGAEETSLPSTQSSPSRSTTSDASPADATRGSRSTSSNPRR